jgi:TrkA domain protein
MGVRVERIDIAGIGFRDDVITKEGVRIGVLTYRDGRREICIADRDDPDSSEATVNISSAEANALAELLGQATLLDSLKGIATGVEGIFTEQLFMPADSKYIDQELGETKARTKTGASIVAIARGNDVVASPTPRTVLESGDILVAVGTRDGLDALAEILAESRN